MTNLGDFILIPSRLPHSWIVVVTRALCTPCLVKLSTLPKMLTSLFSYTMMIKRSHEWLYFMVWVEMHTVWLVTGCLASQKHTTKTAIPIVVQYTHNSQTHLFFPVTPSLFPALERKVYIPSARVTVLCCGFIGLRTRFGFPVISTKQYVFMTERDSVNEAAFSF